MSYIIFGSSIVGQSHTAVGKGRDDSYGFSANDDSAILIVADGAGSAMYSRYGADKIVDVFKSSFENSDYRSCPESFIKDTTKLTLEEIKKMADDMYTELNPDDNKDDDKSKKDFYKNFASTMIVVLTIGNKWYAGHIGDGAVVKSLNHKFELISPPYESEYVNETVFITSNSYENFLNITSGECFDEIFAFTDGIQRGVLDSKAPFEPFFNYMSDFASKITDVENANNEINEILSDKFNDVSDDDKTLVILVNKKS